VREQAVLEGELCDFVVVKRPSFSSEDFNRGFDKGHVHNTGFMEGTGSGCKGGEIPAWPCQVNTMSSPLSKPKRRGEGKSCGRKKRVATLRAVRASDA
jgi:hypothetical protein